MVGSYWVCHWKKTFWVGGCDGIGSLAYLLFCAAYWSRQPRVFRRLSRSCFVYPPSQWETMLQCSIIVSHWLGAYMKWSPHQFSRCCDGDCNSNFIQKRLLSCYNYIYKWETRILLTTFSNKLSWMKVCILMQISLKFVPKDPIDKLPLVQVMAWCRAGNRPLPEPKLSKFHDTINHH